MKQVYVWEKKKVHTYAWLIALIIVALGGTVIDLTMGVTG